MALGAQDPSHSLEDVSYKLLNYQKIMEMELTCTELADTHQLADTAHRAQSVYQHRLP